MPLQLEIVTPERLAAALDAWNLELMDPVFPGAGNRPTKAKQKAAKNQP